MASSPTADDARHAPTAAAVEPIAVAFARVLRGAGLRVPIGSVLMFAEALAEVGLGSREPVYWAARATLVRRPEDLALFDQAFAVFWEQRISMGADGSADDPLHITIALDDGPEDDEADDPDESEANDDPTIQLRFSADGGPAEQGLRRLFARGVAARPRADGPAAARRDATTQPAARERPPGRGSA